MGFGLSWAGVAGHDAAHGGEAYWYTFVLFGAGVYEVGFPEPP
jgi:hypothetical protein